MDADEHFEDFQACRLASLLEWSCDTEVCRSALQKADGDFDRAVEIIFQQPQLQKKGLPSSALGFTKGLASFVVARLPAAFRRYDSGQDFCQPESAAADEVPDTSATETRSSEPEAKEEQIRKMTEEGGVGPNEVEEGDPGPSDVVPDDHKIENRFKKWDCVELLQEKICCDAPHAARSAVDGMILASAELSLYIYDGKECMDAHNKYQIQQFVQEDQAHSCQWAMANIREQAATMFIVFKGTDSAQDVLYDMEIQPIRTQHGLLVHSGFYGGLQAELPEIHQRVLSHHGHIDKIVFTGHSLGGAYATLAALELRNYAGWPEALLTEVVTFGAPLVLCSSAFTANLESSKSESGLQTSVDHQQQLVVEAVLDGSPAHQWNMRYRDHSVRPGDVIVEVNGNDDVKAKQQSLLGSGPWTLQIGKKVGVNNLKINHYISNYDIVPRLMSIAKDQLESIVVEVLAARCSQAGSMWKRWWRSLLCKWFVPQAGSALCRTALCPELDRKRMSFDAIGTFHFMVSSASWKTCSACEGVGYQINLFGDMELQPCNLCNREGSRLVDEPVSCFAVSPTSDQDICNKQAKQFLGFVPTLGADVTQAKLISGLPEQMFAAHSMADSYLPAVCALFGVRAPAVPEYSKEWILCEK